MKKCTLGWRMLLVACIVMAFSLPAWAAKTIKIGVIGPMQSLEGRDHWAGATMAADEINAAGGVKVGNEKMQIVLIKADSNEDKNITDASNAMERLMTKDKVDFVVGGFRTEAVFPMQDIAMDYKKIFIGCGAATDALCDRVGTDYKRYKYYFRGTPFKSSYLAKTSIMHLLACAAVIKKELNAPIKVALVAEKLAWTEGMVKLIQGYVPKLGMELVGTWQPSANATDVTAELSAIQKSGANIIFTVFSGMVGITFARQAGEFKIPALQVGINVESQKDGFWEATKGMGNYVFTMNTYVQGVEQNELTKPFMDGYKKRFKGTPTYTADTYASIKYNLVPAIEAVGSLDSDKLVAFMEAREYLVPSGKVKYEKNKDGVYTHDLTWGPGYLTSVGCQWQDGKLVGVWPNNWMPDPKNYPNLKITYKGMVPIKLPPWMKKQ
ncbi:MAG: ABC transporter substrate-binding protein [Deltaproteobacteria bacterium]|nr:ABC transporter substrate-binding protein [Deltaproteobacteria bacterium]